MFLTSVIKADKWKTAYDSILLSIYWGVIPEIFKADSIYWASYYGAVPFKHSLSEAGIDATKASTCYSILVKTLNEPLEASCNTSPIKVKRLEDVVGSKHWQMAVGLDNPAYVQTPVNIAQTLALASSIANAMFSSYELPNMAW